MYKYLGFGIFQKILYIQTSNQIMNDHDIVQQMVQEALAEITRKVSNQFCQKRKRSGSTPNRSLQKMKQSDLSSITTMAGTQHTHYSDKKIEEVGNYAQRLEIDPEDNRKQLSAWGKKQTKKWVMCKNGSLRSPSMDISNIKYYFMKAATERKMVVMRDLDNIVTVKNTFSRSMGCFFRYCLPIGWDHSVFQLQRSINSQGSRVKFVLVSGNEYEFEGFKQKIYFQLWENGLLELQQFQAIKFVCAANKDIVKFAKTAYEKAYNQCQLKNLDTIEEVQQWQLQLMNTFKQAEQKLYNVVFEKDKTIQKSPQNVQFLSQHILTMIPIEDFYIKSKLQQSKKIHQIRKKIQADLTIGQIFSFLEVEQKFRPFIKMVGSKSIKTVFDEKGFLPFQQSLRYLQEINFGISPMKNIRLISQFTRSLLDTYRIHCECVDPVLDMDSQLPLTIYCILGCVNPQLKPLISLLGTYLQNQDSCENQKRTLAALNASLDFIRQEWNSRQ